MGFPASSRKRSCFLPNKSTSFLGSDFSILSLAASSVLRENGKSAQSYFHVGAFTRTAGAAKILFIACSRKRRQIEQIWVELLHRTFGTTLHLGARRFPLFIGLNTIPEC